MWGQSKLIRHLWGDTLNLLFPSDCPICHRPSDAYRISPICAACWSSIASLSGRHTCRVCSRLIYAERVSICGECYRKRPYFKQTIAFGTYEGVLREAIHLYKFSSIKRLAAPLSSLLNGLDIPEVDLFVGVPLTKKRLKKRGFNQTLLLARNLSKRYGVRLACNLLIKVQETGPQTGLSRRMRLKSLQGAFRVTQQIEDKRIAIIDDVLTTGTTMNACAKALMDGGAREVYSIVLARTIN